MKTDSLSEESKQSCENEMVSCEKLKGCDIQKDQRGYKKSQHTKAIRKVSLSVRRSQRQRKNIQSRKK